VLEVGCGVGNTVFPLMSSCTDPRLFVHACDFSAVAVDIVKGHAEYDTAKCRAFVCDVSEDEFPEDIREDSLDVAVMIFVLSAIEPSKFEQVIAKIFKVCIAGPFVFFFLFFFFLFFLLSFFFFFFFFLFFLFFSSFFFFLSRAS